MSRRLLLPKFERTLCKFSVISLQRLRRFHSRFVVDKRDSRGAAALVVLDVRADRSGGAGPGPKRRGIVSIKRFHERKKSAASNSSDSYFDFGFVDKRADLAKDVLRIKKCL